MYHFRIYEAFIVHPSTYINVKWLTNGKMTNLMQNGTFTNRVNALNSCDIKFIVVHIIMTETICLLNSIVCLVSCAIPSKVPIIAHEQPMKIRLALLNLLSSNNSATAITVGVFRNGGETESVFGVDNHKFTCTIHRTKKNEKKYTLLPRGQVNRHYCLGRTKIGWIFPFFIFVCIIYEVIHRTVSPVTISGTRKKFKSVSLIENFWKNLFVHSCKKMQSFH